MTAWVMRPPAAGVARVPGHDGDAAAARRRLRTALDESVDAGVLQQRRRDSLL